MIGCVCFVRTCVCVLFRPRSSLFRLFLISLLFVVCCRKQSSQQLKLLLVVDGVCVRVRWGGGGQMTKAHCIVGRLCLSRYSNERATPFEGH